MSSSNGNSILVVDDNDSIRSLIRDHLGRKGYRVIEAADGIQGLEKALSLQLGVILLDVVMPGLDGFKVCDLIRQKGCTTPILMLTERTSIEDKVSGFSGGADDYLGKPFDPVELELRIQALLRRVGDAGRGVAGTIRRGELEIDMERHRARLGNVDVELTPIEFRILSLLASNPGRVYSRRDILAAIWDTAYEGYRRNIDPHVNRLRTKIELNPRKPKYILTVWGVGYKFNDQV